MVFHIVSWADWCGERSWVSSLMGHLVVAWSFGIQRPPVLNLYPMCAGDHKNMCVRQWDSQPHLPLGRKLQSPNTVSPFFEIKKYIITWMMEDSRISSHNYVQISTMSEFSTCIFLVPCSFYNKIP